MKMKNEQRKKEINYYRIFDNKENLQDKISIIFKEYLESRKKINVYW